MLVAEDDEDARLIFVRLFEKIGLTNPVLLAADGEEAIELLAGAGQNGVPAPVLALLDLRMPKASGLEVLEHIRSVPALAELAVVMLTGSPDMSDIKRCYDLGAASYLVKPVGFAALNGVIRDLGLSWAFLHSRP